MRRELTDTALTAALLAVTYEDAIILGGQDFQPGMSHIVSPLLTRHRRAKLRDYGLIEQDFQLPHVWRRTKLGKKVVEDLRRRYWLPRPL